MINGAGGGVGTIALQAARARGARVTAVDRAEPPNESKLSNMVELELQAEPGVGP